MDTVPVGANVLDLYARHARQVAEEARRLAGHVAQLVDRPAAHDAYQAAQHLDALADLLEALDR